MGWILANLFLLALILIGAAYTLVGFIALRFFHLEQSTFLMVCAGLVALIGTYYTTRFAHAFIERRH